MRAAYLFHLHRLCGLDSKGIGDLDLMDFGNLTNWIDQWVPFEMRLKEVTLFEQ